ncbi:GxxExxY protein [Pedobacter sp. MW01-1-1]|uniref:GxxExxY protein n=1 Tax=Pedobacter sp. MW01-1-1 TaxID=3383027 RepID=UPI003FF0C70D
MGAAIEVHKSLGPGLLENVYHKSLAHELKLRAISFHSEFIVPVYYKDFKMDTTLKCDLFVEKAIVIELKAVETIKPIFEAQLLTYMNLLSAPKGILLNFNCSNIFRNGQKTYVNDLFNYLPDE